MGQIQEGWLEELGSQNEHCQSHEYVVKNMDRQDKMQEKIIDTQRDMQMIISQLVENSKQVVRLHDRMDKVEKKQWYFSGFVACIAFLPSIWFVWTTFIGE